MASTPQAPNSVPNQRNNKVYWDAVQADLEAKSQGLNYKFGKPVGNPVPLSNFGAPSNTKPGNA